jgi:uncharacterized membrane protein
LNTCPSCRALRPEEDTISESTPEGIAQEVVVENYANVTPEAKAKYNFRESVLNTIADISLSFGLFLVLAAFIAPHVIEHSYSEYTATMASICAAIVLLGVTMATWALLRTVADISRRTREMHERK